MIKSMDDVNKVLAKARETYGHLNQISVCSEELCELSAALSKYIRYQNEEDAIRETKEGVVTELADVYNIIDHIRAIYHLTDEEINLERMKKAERLERWLEKSNTLEYSTKDRYVRG